MLGSSASGLISAFIAEVMLSAIAGALTLYLVMTAWITIRRPAGEIGRFEYYVIPIPVFIAIAGYVLASEAFTNDNGMKDGFPAILYLTYGTGFGVFCTVLDTSVVLRRGVSGAHRLLRHLWRMCFSLFIAVGSLFGGQPQVFPEGIRNSGILQLPTLLILILMLFWISRVIISKKFRSLYS